MSSQSHSIIKTKSGEIDLINRFSEQMANLCASEHYSDIVFIVENQRLPAHRVILAARSEYFRALLYGGLSESTQREIELKISYEAFKVLLQYIYSGHMSVGSMKEDNILDILGLANQYGFTELELSISEYLRQILSINNVCAILDASRLYGLDSLTAVCHTFIDRNASEVLLHSSFKTLSQQSLCGLLERDSFFAQEVQIFTAVNIWRKHNAHIDIADVKAVMSRIRLHLMDLDQILKVVRPSEVLDADRLLDAIEEKTTATSLNYRGMLLPEENIASVKYGSRTIQGELRSVLLDDDNTSYDMEKGYTRHAINDANDQGIIVELGTTSIINHIKILLWDRDMRSYSYFVEVSVNQLQWDRVVDHSQYNCRSWQNLYFPARSVKFIKITGTHNTVNKIFHAVSLQAMYTMSMPTLINGLVSPTHNVATVDMSAQVIEGVSRIRNTLLNGNVTNYDWDCGYTCHQLGSGVILIQLGQPYYIGSLRLLLWDCDDRTYCFYIETSTNQKDWEMAIDKRRDHQRSWQSYSFNPRPVVFIKIVGTYNSANEIFHCVHFECPSQDAAVLNATNTQKSIPSTVQNGVELSVQNGGELSSKCDF